LQFAIIEQAEQLHFLPSLDYPFAVTALGILIAIAALLRKK